MSTWDIPTFSTLLAKVLAKIRDKNPNAAAGPGSHADIWSYTLAHVVHGLHLGLKYGYLNETIFTRASGWVLDQYLWAFGLSDGSGGFGRIKARGSYADDSFTFAILAGGGWVDLDGYQFTDTNGCTYEIDESYTPSGAGTTPALRVIGVDWPEDEGARTNVEVAHAETFTWVSTPDYMGSTITQVVDLDHGANRETDAEGRARLVKELQTPAMGGNWAHWRRVAEESDPGNVDCFVYYGLHDEAYGYGCTDIACMQRGEVGSAREIQSADDLYATISDALEAALPWGEFYRVRILDTNAVDQDVRLVLTLNDTARDSDRCDFDAYALEQIGVGFDVDSYNATTRIVGASQNVSSTMSIGDRVIINCAQAVVDAVGTGDGLSTDNHFRVTTWFDVYDEELNPYNWETGYNPTADRIASGGGHILECVGAIRNLFATLGTYKGNNAAPIPGWVANLRLQAIQSACIVVGDEAGEGVIVDVDISVPAADTAPTAGSGTNTYFLSPGEIVPWEDKT